MNLRHLMPFGFLLLCALLMLSLLIPVEYLPVSSRYDKEHHMLIFASLTLAARFCLPIPSLFSVIAMTLFAALTELSQFLVNYRSANWLDMQANLLGILIATLIILSLEVLKKWKKSSFHKL